MFYPRTDLALELQEYCAEQTQETEGVDTQVEHMGAITVTRVHVDSQSGAERLGKPVGRYVTIEMPALNFQDVTEYEACSDVLRQELENLYSFDKTKPVLIVGLGNRFITADALGPKAADKIFVTRHMHEQLKDLFGDTMASVCAVSPGVLGITGVETAEIVQGVCTRVKPGLILVVDALAARNPHRLNTTVQLCDTGIAPGSGVGNCRAAFNEERFGVPVIAIGVPTVIDAMTMAYDTAYELLHAVRLQAGDALSCLQNLSDGDLYALVEGLMHDRVGALTVTPKEVDMAMERISKVIAGGINLYLHKQLTIAEIDSLTM